jgi:hypothetical protein
MKTIILWSGLSILVCGTALMVASPSVAATIKLKAELKPSNEVPPNDSKGTGSVDITFDEATKKLTWKGTYANLTGPAVAAHFHGPAQAGKNAGILIPIFVASASQTPFEGSAILTDEQIGYLNSGMLYVNIHTNTNKAGELRGQVTK